MGAWGHASFENDSALDWLGDLADGNTTVAETLEAVGAAANDTYVDASDASAALAAAELVAAALGKGDERLSEGAVEWLGAHRDEVRSLGASPARRAVERVYRKSELRELWDENGAETEWHAEVRALLGWLA